MICRYWRGWTTPEKAGSYQRLLQDKIMPGIEAHQIPGLLRYQMMRRDFKTEVEFATIMWWDRLESIKGFVGDDIETANMPASAQKILSRWDERVVHYEVFGDTKIR